MYHCVLTAQALNSDSRKRAGLRGNAVNSFGKRSKREDRHDIFPRARQTSFFFLSFQWKILNLEYLFAIHARPIISNLPLSFHVIDR